MDLAGMSLGEAAFFRLLVELTKMLAWTRPLGLTICLSPMVAHSNVSRIRQG